jgi:hypothetical protein
LEKDYENGSDAFKGLIIRGAKWYYVFLLCNKKGASFEKNNAEALSTK